MEFPRNEDEPRSKKFYLLRVHIHGKEIGRVPQKTNGSEADIHIGSLRCIHRRNLRIPKQQGT
jgi:hypothetical protein